MKFSKRQIVGLAAGALLLAGCSANASDSGQVEVKGSTQEKQEQTVENQEFITLDEAKEAAFTHAEVDGSQAKFDDQELERDDRLYELEFYVDGVEYEYDIHAASGEILKAERDDKNDDGQKDKVTKQSKEETEFINLDEAKEAAFTHAGVDGSQAKFDDRDLDDDDHVYELEFYVDGVEYEYDVSALDGSIISSEQDEDADGNDDREEKQAVKAEQKQEKNQPKELTKEQALEIALNHAGVSRSEVTIDDLERDDDGFEIEFESGSRDYEYDIARDGSISDYETDQDDDDNDDYEENDDDDENDDD